MKARSRPSLILSRALLLVWLTVALAITVPPGPANAKTVTTTQVGDPTDTDPGPSPGKAKALALWTQPTNEVSARTKLPEIRLSLKQWVELILMRFRLF